MIIDKVISQRSLDTLQVLGFALVVVTILEGILNSLKTFLFAETTNRIDQRLGSEVIDHLLRLPLGYFDRRPVGELGTRVAELEKIRNFLTGQALTTILDAAFLRDLHHGDGCLQLVAHADCSFGVANSDWPHPTWGLRCFAVNTELLQKKMQKHRAILLRFSPEFKP